MSAEDSDRRGKDRDGRRRFTATGPESAPERVRTRDRMATALTTAGFGDVFVLSQELAEDLLTTQRRELLDVLATRDIDTVRELARAVDRDPGNVSRDLRRLGEAGVVHLVEDGRSKRPELTHGTIVTEPVVATRRDHG